MCDLHCPGVLGLNMEELWSTLFFGRLRSLLDQKLMDGGREGMFTAANF